MTTVFFIQSESFLYHHLQENLNSVNMLPHRVNCALVTILVQREPVTSSRNLARHGKCNKNRWNFGKVKNEWRGYFSKQKYQINIVRKMNNSVLLWCNRIGNTPNRWEVTTKKVWNEPGFWLFSSHFWPVFKVSQLIKLEWNGGIDMSSEISHWMSTGRCIIGN